MVSLFIFNSNSRGMQYGMGTYIKELTGSLLRHSKIKIYLVTYYNTDFKEFTIETISTRYFKINIPSPLINTIQNNLFDKKYAAAVVNLISQFILENNEIVFQMNHVNDLPVIKRLKEVFTFPIISIVHFAQWQQFFNGNKNKLKGLNINNPSNYIELSISKEREMYQLSDHIISVTSYMKKFLVEEFNIPLNKIDVVPNGLNYRRFQSASEKEKLKLKYNLGFSPREKIILYSGRIDSCKGVYFLIDAFIHACKYMDDLRLVLIGSGNLQEYLSKFNSFYGKITFTGFLPSDTIRSFYKIADIGVVPSVYDHCPYSVLEMMASRIPLVVSKINGLDEMLSDDQCVFIDPILTDEGEITFNNRLFGEAILYLIKNRMIGKRLATRAEQVLRAQFSDFCLAQGVKHVYCSVIDNQKNPSP